MNPIVQLKNIAKEFHAVEIFRDISLDIQSGERFALLGPSGCGKSTLLRLIAGLDAPTNGELWIDGQAASLAGRILLPAHQRGLAMVFQDLALWPNLTVHQNVELGLAGTSLARVQRRERAESALSACRIAELGGRKPGELSGGQQQRVALARALTAEPKLLLLDEPFSSLDIANKSHLYAVIRRLCTDFHLTLIVVSHDPLEAAALCSHAAVLERGRIAEIGGLQALLRNPVSETLREFVAQLPVPTRKESGAPARSEESN
ncbi:MAG: ABC transporter ATP-binding protein [Gammaproteobacteria bacterium]|nr:ABC transporter ATP-binding protein [Gammaproteobacteria bacterium]